MLGSGLINGEIIAAVIASPYQQSHSILQGSKSRNVKSTKIVMSGGQGPDELLPESVAMKMYALTQGIPDDDILVEAHSKTH